MNKRVYLSGKMSGLPDHGKARFDECTKRLRDAGYSVLSPSEMDGGLVMQWHEYLRRDLRWLVDCDIIALIPNWDTSRGAKLELLNALILGMDVICADTLEPLKITTDVIFLDSETEDELAFLVPETV